MPTRGDRLRSWTRPLGERRGALWQFIVVGALAVLWSQSGARLSPRGSDASEGPELSGRGSRSPGSTALPRLASTQRVFEPSGSLGVDSSQVDQALTQHVVALIETAKRRAEQKSKGKLKASEVRVAVCVTALSSVSVVAGSRSGAPAALVRLEAKRSMRPASNMKLVTTAAALAIGGAQAQFTTRFDALQPPLGGVLEGDLVVRAGGDPFLGPDGATDGSGVERLDEIAKALAAGGLRRVTGNLVLDEGSFETPAPGPEWPDAGQHWQDYCALAGGFTVNGGCLVAVVRSTTPGSPAKVSVTPSDHGLRNDWRVQTKKSGQLVIGFEARLGRVLVRGSIPKSVSRFTNACSHPDPVLLFGHALSAALLRAGIEVRGELVRARGVEASHELLSATSPVLDCLVPINTESNNGVADQLFFATGLWALGDASRAGAARATASACESLGISAEGLHQVDGSGLSFANRVTAEQLVGLLSAVHLFAAEGRGGDAAQRLRASLAVSGRTGTLEQRMRGTCAEGRVLGKTGFIRGTSALSGFIDAERGPLAFAILVEYPPYDGLNTSVFKPLQDDICVALCGTQ